MSNDVMSHAYNPANGDIALSEALINEPVSLGAAFDAEQDLQDAVYMDVLDRLRTCD